MTVFEDSPDTKYYMMLFNILYLQNYTLNTLKLFLLFLTSLPLPLTFLVKSSTY